MTKTKRIKYNTPISFPNTFTLKELRKAQHHKIKYITLYSRVQKGLESGTLVESGLKTPDSARRGRKEVIYKCVTQDNIQKDRFDKMDITEQAADIAVPSSVVNW